MQQAIHLYAARFSDKITPLWRSFYSIIKLFSNEGNIQPKKWTRQINATDENSEIGVLAPVHTDPHVSLLELIANSELSPDDFYNRVPFRRWAQNKILNNNNFFYCMKLI